MGVKVGILYQNLSIYLFFVCGKLDAQNAHFDPHYLQIYMHAVSDILIDSIRSHSSFHFKISKTKQTLY
jgi:hypothetical protein